MSAPAVLTLTALPGVPMAVEGDEIATLILDGLARADLALAAGDIVAVAQKLVSKAEGRLIALSSVTPSARALELAQISGKDARLVELILSELTEVLRVRPGGVIIVQHHLGFVMANAGIDQSNVGHDGEERALLLPRDPDGSAAQIREALRQRAGVAPAVLIIDSIGRAWRQGTVGTALGLAGLAALLDLRGQPDLYGRPLQTSTLGLADEVASAASLTMGQADEGRPIVLVRGMGYGHREGCAAELIRPKDMDLFR